MSSSRPRTEAFTLVELLVVLTIIVVLLAMLAPALDKSLYQSKLTVCGAQMKGVAGGASLYAIDHKLYYPKRDVIDVNLGQPYILAGDDANKGWVEDRLRMRGHIPIKLLADPMSPKIALDVEDTVGAYLVHSGIPLYFGVTFSGYDGMKKMGDRFSYTDRFTGITHRYSLVAADLDFVGTVDERHISGHLDKAGVMGEFYSTSGGYFTSRYEDAASNGLLRGNLDLNYTYADGSVKRLTDVEILDDRTATIPHRADHYAYDNWVVQLPKE